MTIDSRVQVAHEASFDEIPSFFFLSSSSIETFFTPHIDRRKMFMNGQANFSLIEIVMTLALRNSL